MYGIDNRLKVFLLSMMFIVILSISHETLLALPNPQPPQVSYQGEAGDTQAAYWIVAVDEEGRLTDLSPPTVLSDLPANLDQANRVTITVRPIEGARAYHILKTTVLPPPDGVTVTPAQPGNKTYYYWLVARNTWRNSAVAGPFEMANAAEAKGAVITWQPVPDANGYDVFRTTSPQPPVGRYEIMVGNNVRQTTWTDPGKLGWQVIGLTPTPVDAKPIGKTLALLATLSANERTAYDQGQPLQTFAVPNINESDRLALEIPREKTSPVGRGGRPGRLHIETYETDHMATPTFGVGANVVRLDQTILSGGHSDYPGIAPKIGGKNYYAPLEMHQTSHVASQHGMLSGYQRGYGTGDMIYLHTYTDFHGANNDPGDEGVYPIRQAVTRSLNRYETTLANDASTGSEQVVLEHLNDKRFGSERLLINFSKAIDRGRIVRVGNSDVRGQGTDWSTDLVGQWISFDIDNVEAGDQTYRMWYPIAAVEGPDRLTILARTGWSARCNLGYSRFIFDPAQTDRPKPVITNKLAIRNLPSDRLPAAREGRYMIAPGTLLGDPWNPEGNTLNVEPLSTDWQAGDKVAIVAGPQAYITGGRLMLHGKVLPQDMFTGWMIRNNTNRKTNGPGIQIGIPGEANFADGVHITLAPDGYSNGLVISAANGWTDDGLPGGSIDGVYQAAIVVPDNLPAISGPHHWRYPHLRWKFDTENQNRDAMQIAMRTGDQPVLASFHASGVSKFRKLEIEQGLTLAGKFKGNDQTRGKQLLSGDGQTKRFTIRFTQPQHQVPVVVFNTDQFTASRLVGVTRDLFVIEFATPPAKGNENITLWWTAQQ